MASEALLFIRLVLALGFLLVISMTVNTALQLALARFEWVLPVMAAAITWLSYALGFALMYMYLPDRRIGWRVRCSAARSRRRCSLSVAGPSAGTSTVQTRGGVRCHGCARADAIWVYYAGMIVFIGALLTAVIDERGKASAGPAGST